MINRIRKWWQDRLDQLDEEYLWQPMREDGIDEETIEKCKALHKELGTRL